MEESSRIAQTQDSLELLRLLSVDSLWLKQFNARRTLLVVYAHPDDETFISGSTLARYSDTDVAIHYVCATRGEAGVFTAKDLEGYSDVATMRTAELIAASTALGITALHFLPYRDSGMVGEAANLHPSSLFQAPMNQVIEQITVLIRLLRPHIVITFGPYGGYGHPDHIKMHHATSIAFELAGKPSYYPHYTIEGLHPWSPRKLYYSTFDTYLLKRYIGLLRTIAIDPSRFGKNRDINLVRAVEEATPVTTLIDGRLFWKKVGHAWRAHRSQLETLGPVRYVPSWVRGFFMGKEAFTRVIPRRDTAQEYERDLFL